MTEPEISGWLARWLAERTARDAASLGPELSLASLGLGSRDAVELAADLSDWLGFEVSATAAWDHPTLGQLARHLAGGAAPAAAPAPVDAHEPIAVIGLACRFPGAPDAEAFWDLLARGGDAIGPVPADRPYYARAARHGGFVEGLDRFDAVFFGITPREAAALDPQQRLLLELSWDALETAGVAPRSLAGQPVGTFMGLAASDYGRLLLADPARADPFAGTGNALSIAANRIAYTLDLVGPSLAVDTACSSSLVAVHLACQSLRRGESALALAGGANVLLDPAVTLAFTRAGFLAPDGRCRAFAAGASGYVRSEGAGVVALAQLSLARARGWPVRALILGSAVNQDGRSNGLTAPSRQRQEEVLSQAHADARIVGGDVQYVEAHGTGTPLGDPIEAAALGRVLATGRPPSERCWIGSVKSNIGHLEAAAGIAGLIKTVLALEHRRIPPSLHFDAPNPRIAFADLPLAVPTSLTPWPAHRGPARAGVSAFGFGGTNAHVVLEASPAPATPHPRRAWQRERHWADLAPPRSDGGHPWLGAGLESSLHPGEWSFDVELSPRRDAWLHDHQVAGAAIFPLAAHLELALSAARAAGRPLALADVAVDRPLQLGEEPVRVQTVVSAVDTFQTAHRTERGFVVLARGRLAHPAPADSAPLAALRARCRTPVDVAGLYARLASAGLAYGPAFRGVRAAWRAESEALAELAPPPEPDGWTLHPARLDAAFHVLAALLPAGAPLSLPVSAAHVERAGAAVPAFAHARLNGTTAEVALYAADGAAVARIAGLELRSASPRAGPRTYRVSYGLAPGATAAPGSAGARWLLIPDQAGQALSLAAALERRGSRVRVAAEPGLVAGEPPDAIADLRALDDAAPLDASAALARCQALLPLLREHAAGRLVVAARPGATGGLRGLLATFALERPTVDVALVELDGDPTHLLDLPPDEPLLKLSNGQVLAARLEELAAPAAVWSPPLDPAATYLVTGGMGALGQHAARALAAGGARDIVLAGRRVQAGAVDALSRELGVPLRGLALDVADPDAVQRAVGGLERLKGVLHAAGALADATLAQQTPDSFARAFAAKAHGAWNLHRACRDLDHFVLFSSVAGVIGSAGQASYAAANAYLDALALSRRQSGLAALSIAWGPWAGEGMAADAAARFAAAGLTPIDPAGGRAALAAATGAGEPCVAILDARWSRVAERLPRRLPLLAGLAPPAPAEPALADLLAAAPPDARHALLLEHLARQAAAILGTPGAALERDVPLIDLGLDSLVTLELQQWLERALRTSVPGSHFLGNPTLAGLASSLLGARPAAPARDLAADVELDPRVDGSAPRSPAVPQRVLLTGATGYLGAYLLHELLERSAVRVDCLVRAGDASAGRAAIARNFGRYRPWNAAWDERVRAVPGDLSAPGLGLAPRVWDELADAVDVIVHAGAWVNFAYAYEVLRDTNAGGTAEILRLATHRRTRHVHHVSTVGMLLSTAHPPGVVLHEDDAHLPWQGLSNGYEQSKWVADRIAALARQKGVPVSIHRVGLLSGESDTGRWLKRDDFFPAWIKGCIQLGAMPRLDTLTALVPVDYASRLLVELALSAVPPRTYHVTHPAPVPLSELARVAAAAGLPVDLVSFAEWKARLAAAIDGNELAHHRHFVELLEEQQSLFPRLDDAHARAAADHLSIVCPPVPELVARYLAHWRACGWITSARG